MSLAIFISATASPRTAAIAATIASSEPCAANLFGGGDEGTAGQLGDLGGDLAAEARRRVEPGADRRAPGGQLDRDPSQRRGCAPARRGSAAPIPTIPVPTVSGTASCRCVRPILTTSFHFLRLRLDRGGERLRPRQQMLFELQHRGDVHRGREGVVRRLAHVDVVVRDGPASCCRSCRRAAGWRGWTAPR